MARGNLVVGLDVGTTKVACIIAEVTAEKQINICGVGVSPAVGLRKGIVVDLENTVNSIEKTIEKAERMAGVKIDSIYVGIAGEHISSLNSHGIVAVSGANGEITNEDKERVLEAAKIIPIPSDREVIHVIPRYYIIDGCEGVKNPVGMSGRRLEVEVHIVSGAISFIQNLLKCIHRVGLTVNDLVLQQVASSLAILTPDEKEIGVALADIGGGTTDLAIFLEGSIVYTKSIPVAGNHIDKDLAYGLPTTLFEAERIKREYGYALTSLTPEGEMIKFVGAGEDKETKEIPRRLIAEVIEARCSEIMDLLKAEIYKSGYQDLIPAGVVLTGGCSLLKGIATLAKENLSLPVRIGMPKNVGGLIEEISSPVYATGVGLVLYASQDYNVRPIRRTGKPIFGDVIESLKRWFKEFV